MANQIERGKRAPVIVESSRDSVPRQSRWDETKRTGAEKNLYTNTEERKTGNHRDSPDNDDPSWPGVLCAAELTQRGRLRSNRRRNRADRTNGQQRCAPANQKTETHEKHTHTPDGGNAITYGRAAILYYYYYYNLYFINYLPNRI